MGSENVSKGKLRGLWAQAKGLKGEIIALFLAVKHPLTPWYAKLVAALVVGYALSPIDLIPDFIPILGYLDDVILLPLGIALSLRLIPVPILTECRSRAAVYLKALPRLWIVAVIVVLLWVAAGWALFKLFQ